MQIKTGHNSDSSWAEFKCAYNGQCLLVQYDADDRLRFDGMSILTRGQVAALLPLLKRFVDTGKLDDGKDGDG